MSVTKRDTEYVAKLARLGLSEKEKDIFTEQLNSILGYIDIINSVDTGDIKPFSHSGGSSTSPSTPMRDDKAFPFMETAKILDAAPRKEENMFRVPKILETEN